MPLLTGEGMNIHCCFHSAAMASHSCRSGNNPVTADRTNKYVAVPWRTTYLMFVCLPNPRPGPWAVDDTACISLKLIYERLGIPFFFNGKITERNSLIKYLLYLSNTHVHMLPIWITYPTAVMVLKAWDNYKKNIYKKTSFGDELKEQQPHSHGQKYAALCQVFPSGIIKPLRLFKYPYSLYGLWSHIAFQDYGGNEVLCSFGFGYRDMSLMCMSNIFNKMN